MIVPDQNPQPILPRRQLEMAVELETTLPRPPRPALGRQRRRLPPDRRPPALRRRARRRRSRSGRYREDWPAGRSARRSRRRAAQGLSPGCLEAAWRVPRKRCRRRSGYPGSGPRRRPASRAACALAGSLRRRRNRSPEEAATPVSAGRSPRPRRQQPARLRRRCPGRRSRRSPEAASTPRRATLVAIRAARTVAGPYLASPTSKLLWM